MLVAGDVMPHRPRLVRPDSVGRALEPLSTLFAGAHAVVVNHEAAVVDDLDPYLSKRAALVAEPGWSSEIARARVAALTLANNHACDAGLDGVRRGIDAIGDTGLIGIGVDERDPFRARVLAAAAGRRVCALAWTAQVNQPRSKCATSGLVAIAPFGVEGEDTIARAVKAARAGGCDALIAIGHAGDEYESQGHGARAQASAAAEAGASAVVFHHPHVPSGIEIITTRDGRRVPVFLSVGNLVSNQGDGWHLGLPPTAPDRSHVSRNAWTRLGLVADLAFRWDESRPASAALVWGYHLVWTDHQRGPGTPHEPARKAKLEPEGGALITTRLLDPASDAAIVRRLTEDRDGPAGLFASPCWRNNGPGCR